MIIRLTAKLGKKIGYMPTQSSPLHTNPFADWSARLFIADRIQHILITNTSSLYSVIILGRGISDDDKFIRYSMSVMRDFMKTDGLELIFEQHIEPEFGFVTFAKALNRSVTGSMNDLVYIAKSDLEERGMSPFDASLQLNRMPMSYIGMRLPREVFNELQR